MNTNTDHMRADHGGDPRRLEREIDQQRDHIGEIVDALGQKLSPGDIVDRMMRSGKAGGGDFARNLSQTVRDNPVPALLASAGLIWLFASRHDGHSHAGDPGARYGDTTRMQPGVGTGGGTESAAGLHATTAPAAHDAQPPMAHLGEKLHGVGDRIGHGRDVARDSLRHGGERARNGFEHLLHDNPMVLGALAMAVGSLLGAVVPISRKEDELLGDTGATLRSKVSESVDAAKGAASDLKRDVARDTGPSREASVGRDGAGDVGTTDGTRDAAG